MGPPDVAEVPGLGGDAGDALFAGLVALYEAVVRREGAKLAAYAVIGKGGADKIYLLGPEGEVDGEACLVL